MAASDIADCVIDGHCLCKAVKITLNQPKKHVEICQCAMCRRWGGAFYSALSGESFSIAGEDSVSVYRSSEWAERAFCKQCGSNLWYKFLPTGNRSFLAGLFADADQYPIEREIFADEAAAWCKLAGDHPRLSGAETIAEAKEAGFDLG
ncbi:GFA family protein [Altererythrobacter sp. Z27]|uniref:GFA family protein n=1 Tax=Altererythrobacter sp. Z27 TaxID=3461147 RepID=UPI0040446B96